MAGRNRRNALHRPGAVIHVWLSHHGRSALASLGDLARAPLATVMTVGVVAIALALPAGLHLATRNLATLAQGWQQDTGLSLFLTPNLDDGKAKTLAEQLARRPELAKVRLITPAEGLAELRESTGLAGAVGLLADNPLPTVLAVEPTSALAADPAAMEALRNALASHPDVADARLDTAWVRRLHALLDLGATAALVLATLLSVTVLLVVGNTLRLEVANRRREVEIMALVGATRAFVRRPFLYAGAWYGLLGALIAVMIVTLGVVLVQSPVTRLATLYGTEFRLAWLDAKALLTLLAGGPMLGLIGAWLAVGRHLAACEPR